QAEDGIRDRNVTGVQTCALPIFKSWSNPTMPSLGSAVSPLNIKYINVKMNKGAINNKANVRLSRTICWIIRLTNAQILIPVSSLLYEIHRQNCLHDIFPLNHLGNLVQ